MNNLFAHEQPIPDDFVGRKGALRDLSDWLTSRGSTFVIHAMGGMGKSTLARVWAERVVARFGEQEQREQGPPSVFWWSFYEGDAGFRNFLASFSSWISGADPAQKNTPEDEFGIVTQLLTTQPCLLVLDGFERELRAFAPGVSADRPPGSNECTDPLAAEFLRFLSTGVLKSHVLLTSRVVPAELGTRSDYVTLFALEGLSDGEVVEFFRVNGIRGSDEEIIAISARYGHHPLALQLLAGRLRAAGSAEIGDVREWDIVSDPKTSHIFSYATQDLKHGESSMLRLLCASPDNLSLDFAESLAKQKNDFNEQLHDLERRGLTRLSDGVIVIHPLVRVFVNENFNVGPSEHQRIANALLRSALKPGSSLYDDLRVSLRLTYHLSRSNDLIRALFHLQRCFEGLYYFAAEYEDIIDATDGFFLEGLFDERLPNVFAQTYVLTVRANCFEKLGEFDIARGVFEEVLKRDYIGENPLNIGITSTNLGRTYMWLGEIRQARETFDSIPESSLAEPQIKMRVFLFGGLLRAMIGDATGREEALEATQFFDLQNASLETAQSVQALAVSFAYLAETLLELDDLDGAMKHAKLAVSAAAASGSKRELARSEVVLAACTARLQRTSDTLIRDVDKALILTRATRQPELETKALLIKSDLLLASGDSLGARRVALETLRKSVRMGLQLHKVESHLQLARLDGLSNRQEDAAFHLSKAMEALGADPEFAVKRLIVMADHVSREVNALGRNIRESGVV